MPQDRSEHIVTARPIGIAPAEGAVRFADTLPPMMDGEPKDDATVAGAAGGLDDIVDQIAAGLYRVASMLLGEGDNSIGLVETAIVTADISACSDAGQARKTSRHSLCGLALDSLVVRDASSLAAPQGLEHATTCISDDDLDAVSESDPHLEQMLASSDNDHMRNWLESLPEATRAIFVLRAVARFSTAQTATLLREHGGPNAAGWSGDAVRELFRQGMCSLASQALHAAR